jgi:hypothetical protein
MSTSLADDEIDPPKLAPTTLAISLADGRCAGSRRHRPQRRLIAA